MASQLVRLFAMLASAPALAGPAHGAFVQFLNDKPAWAAATGPSTVVGFAQYPTGTVVTDQYAGLGLLLADGDDFVTQSVPWNFPQDGVGLIGGPSITFDFAMPIAWVAFDFPGLVQALFFLDDELLFTSGPLLAPGPTGVGGFAGFISDAPFDRVVVTNWGSGPGVVAIDTIYFQPVPAPACTLLPLAALMAARRRRRD